uniref:Uncharacterized protein n=1 Tax=Ditylenchus dipsaci TaxID=166011 RepID=A0A915DZ48_9BILA
MNTAIPGSSSLVDLEDLTDDTDLSELEAELESLGILVKRIDGEKIFYTGHLTNAEVVDKLNSEFNKDTDIKKCSRFERLIRDFLLDELNWDVITLPMQSESGVQDTFFKALLLSRQFQYAAFKFLMVKLDKIGTNKSCTRDDKEFGKHLVSHVRYIEKIHNTRALLSLVFDKDISTWISPLREDFVRVLPEMLLTKAHIKVSP